MKEEIFERYWAFRLRGNSLQVVERPHIPKYSELLCIERQKEVVFRNTKQFVLGFPANDVLLWGARGTGKSSLVKSMLGLFKEQGLRIIQVFKEESVSLTYLYELLWDLKQRFILFFDDLSFEREEEITTLKSLLEGDIEERPENLLVYVTSNRRNLIKELFEERDRFPSDTSQEVQSLVDRFGIRVGFFTFNKEEYLELIKHYARLYNVKVPFEELKEKALLWATERGSFSGRTAHQFIRDLKGRLLLKEHGA